MELNNSDSKQKIIEIIQSVVGMQVGIFLFGSRARGDNKLFSDYDIGLIGEFTLNHGMISSISEKLTQSNIPFKIDIVDFNSVPETFKSIAMESIEIWSNPEMIKSFLKSKQK